MSPSLLNLYFVALLCAAVGLRVIVPARFHGYVGAAVSAILIGLASPSTLLFIGGTALFLVYPASQLIQRAKGRSTAAARGVLIGSVVAMVGLLVAYKIGREFRVPLLTDSRFGAELISVFGLSYFFFRALNALYMHFLVDIEEKGPWTLLYYSLFPPTITSGPIQKYIDFRQQLESPQPLNRSNISLAVYRITRGYFWKITAAWLVGQLVDGILAPEALTGYRSMAALIGVYIQMFFDFAGYTEIAIGFGLLLGVRVPENFRRPFTATSLTEFWRNWHITLVDNLRDMVFIPAGGMRSSLAKASFLALAVMVLCGLWHGLTPLFLAWGFYHGLLLMFEALTKRRPLPPPARHGPRYWGRVAVTNLQVAVGCIFFMPTTEGFRQILEGFGRW